MPPVKIPHIYGPSMVGHGEQQCIFCLGTNRENAVLSPDHCEPRAKIASDAVSKVNLRQLGTDIKILSEDNLLSDDEVMAVWLIAERAKARSSLLNAEGDLSRAQTQLEKARRAAREVGIL